MGSMRAAIENVDARQTQSAPGENWFRLKKTRFVQESFGELDT